MSSSITMSEPRLNWDVTPKNGLKAFFSPENYKDHSMAPSLKELYILSNRGSRELMWICWLNMQSSPQVPRLSEQIPMNICSIWI
ncbi:mCG129135, isoform CRA_b [Mus musculus]|nr:mCG129135, isoform CRA_b [Mus musculus]